MSISEQDTNLTDLSDLSKELTLIDTIDGGVLKRPLAVKIIQLWCTGQFSKKEVANILRITPATVSRYLHEEEVMSAIEQYQKNETRLIDQQLKGARTKAMETMYELMDSIDDKVRFQASKDVLDRTGHLATMKKEVTITHKTFEEQLAEIMDADYSVE